jgi:hypothetical protein
MSTPLVDSFIDSTPAAEVLSQVAAAMLALSEAATPDRWVHMCLGSEGCQVIRDCGPRERDRRHVARFTGKREWQHDHADAAYLTGMQPAVARATARLLAELAGHAAHGSQGALVADGMDIARAFMDATGWRP